MKKQITLLLILLSASSNAQKIDFLQEKLFDRKILELIHEQIYMDELHSLKNKPNHGKNGVYCLEINYESDTARDYYFYQYLDIKDIDRNISGYFFFDNKRILVKNFMKEQPKLSEEDTERLKDIIDPDMYLDRKFWFSNKWGGTKGGGLAIHFDKDNKVSYRFEQ